MHHRSLKACGLAALLFAAVGAPAAAAPGHLDGYRVKATKANLDKLAKAGFDVEEGINRKRGTIDVFGTEQQVRAVKVGARLVTDQQGRSSAERSGARRSQRAARVADPTAGADDSTFTVWTKYDAVAGDEKEQYTEQYARVQEEHPDLVKQRVVGETYNGREILALQVTKGATGADIPGRPAVLYNAMQHAREWLAGETCRRTLDFMLENYGKTTSAGLEVTPLVDNNELWFVCVNNPDGYEFTFTPGNRLWRKNLADNDANGVIAPGDGVDPNRNFAANWGRDDEGSSPDPADETYRGPSPASEPETKAMEALFAEIKPVFQKNDHTAAELLLYPQGFQQDTPTADDQIFTALAGDPFKPAIEGFLPELAAGLYITNGDFTDWAYSSQKTLSYTPEGTSAEDPDVTGFEYPDSPLQVRQEFQRHLPFVLDLAKSAKDPADPVSHLGNTSQKIVVDDFPVSYGDPQPVQATLQRKLGEAELFFRVNGGQTLKVPTTEWAGGERYYKNDAVYYHRVRGVISGTKPGDSVEAWFAAGGVESKHFTYAAQVESGNPVLLLANEDWSGKVPEATPLGAPKYLQTYKQLLDQAGVKYDVYDIDQQGRAAPDELGVLKHYSHVVWYTGDDYVSRDPAAPGRSGIDRLAVDTQNRVRDFLNEGGKLFYTGQHAGRQFAEGYEYNPFQKEEGEYCNTSTRCIAVQDDFLQYWLGANSYIAGGGADADDNVLPVSGFKAPFTGKPPYVVTGNYPDDYQAPTFLITSSVYDTARYPLWADSAKLLAWDRPGRSPFEPYAGESFAAAGTDDAAYKRLQQEVDLRTKTSASLSFRASYDLEADYDYLFVEIRTKGQDDWTTLAERSGITEPGTGESCKAVGALASNWQTNHPFLKHYQTVSPDGKTCTPTGNVGTPAGQWNAVTGKSRGWEPWTVDVPAAYLNKEVEISITVATDAGTTGLGVWIDDTRVTTNSGAGPLAGFETDLAPWTTPGPPAGTTRPITGWERAQTTPFIEGAAVGTQDTVYTGFGLEQIEGTANQLALLKDTFTHLGTPVKPAIAFERPRPAGAQGPPPSVPGPPPGKGKGKVKALRLDKQKLRTARRLGAQLYARCEGDCRLNVELRLERAAAKRYKLKSVIVGRATVVLTGGQGKKVRVRMTKTALKQTAKAKRLRLFVVATGAEGRSIAGTTLK